MSDDGRFILFSSEATNLVDGDTNGKTDIFLRDNFLRVTRRVSVGPGGEQGEEESQVGALSGDGTVVAFISKSLNWDGVTPDMSSAYLMDELWYRALVWVHNLETGDVRLISMTDSPDLIDLSQNGRYLLFGSHLMWHPEVSARNNEASISPTSQFFMLFILDRETNSLSHVPKLPRDAASYLSEDQIFFFTPHYATLNGDGARVAFTAQISVDSRVSGSSLFVSRLLITSPSDSFARFVTHSSDGYPPEMTARGLNQYERPSVSQGGQWTAYMSSFLSDRGTRRSRTYLYDRNLDQEFPVSWSTPFWFSPGFSVAINGSASVMVAAGPSLEVATRSDGTTMRGQAQVYRQEISSGRVERITTGIDGGPGDNRDSYGDDSRVKTRVSLRGDIVAFSSYDGNLVQDDTNGVRDVFVAAQQPVHFGCREEMCAAIDGPGEDTCDIDDDCRPPPPQSHMRCLENQCFEIVGPGDNQCSATPDCSVPPPPEETHLGCQNNACVTVSGPGPDGCANNTECLPDHHSFACTDSDRATGTPPGNAPAVAGYITQYRDSDTPQIRWDKCCGNTYLRELYCNENTGQYEVQWFGCKLCEAVEISSPPQEGQATLSIASAACREGPGFGISPVRRDRVPLKCILSTTDYDWQLLP